MVVRGGTDGPVPLLFRLSRSLPLLGLLWLLTTTGACGTTGSGQRRAHPAYTATADGRVELKVGSAIDWVAKERRWAEVADRMRQGMGDAEFRNMMREFDRTHPLSALLRDDPDHAFYHAQLRCRDGVVRLPTGCIQLTIRLPDGRRVTCRDQGIIARVRHDESRIQDSRVRPVTLSPAWDPAASADGIFKLMIRCAVRGTVETVTIDESLVGR